VKLLGTNAKELDEAGEGQITDRLAVCMGASIAREFNELASFKGSASEKFRKFCALCDRHVALWKTGQDAKWIELERERLKIQSSLADIKRKAMPWTMRVEYPGGRKISLGGHTFTTEQMDDVLALMSGSRKDEAEARTVEHTPESSPVKASQT
jgi:hypothetical protein